MRRHLFFIAAGLLLGCDLSAGGSKCEEARTLTMNLMDDACQSAEYSQTPFCVCCVESGYYSINDDCTCRDLVFNAETCLFANGQQGKPSVRTAIELANTTCKTMRLEPWAEVPEGASAVCKHVEAAAAAGAGGSAGQGGGGGMGGASGGGM